MTMEKEIRILKIEAELKELDIKMYKEHIERLDNLLKKWEDSA